MREGILKMTGYCLECGRIADLECGICHRCWRDRAETGDTECNPIALAEHELYTEAIAKLERVLELKREQERGR